MKKALEKLKDKFKQIKFDCVVFWKKIFSFSFYLKGPRKAKINFLKIKTKINKLNKQIKFKSFSLQTSNLALCKT